MKKLFTVLVSLIVIFAMPIPFLGAENELTGEITVSCYDTMRYKSTLEYAAKFFEQKHPGVKVNVSTFSAIPVIKTANTESGTMISISEYENDSKKEEDYLSRINTEMMSGNGADIYAIDVLPYYKYADAGQFEDLRKYMDTDSDFNYNDYQKNIFDATMYKGGQYILPIDFGFQYLCYDATLMDNETQEKFTFGRYTYKELVEMGYYSFTTQSDSDSEYPIKFFNLYPSEDSLRVGTLFGELFLSDYNAIVDIANKKANFTDGRFTDMLNIVSEYTEKGYLRTQVNYQEMMSEGININEIISRRSPQRYLYKSTYHAMFMFSFGDESRLELFDSGVISKDDTLIGLTSNDEGETPFEVTQIYAMNSNSKNKQAAWEFLKLLLSDDIQGSMSISHTPVNNKAAVQKDKLMISILMMTPDDMSMNYESIPMDENDTDTDSETEEPDIYSAINDIASYSYFDMDVELTEKQQAVYDVYTNYMESLTSMLNSYVIRDSVIDRMIEKEVQDYFNGVKTAAEVAAVLQSKVNMYLQE